MPYCRSWDVLWQLSYQIIFSMSDRFLGLLTGLKDFLLVSWCLCIWWTIINAFINKNCKLSIFSVIVGAGCGVIVAIIIVIFDQFTKTPTLKNPMLMVLIVMCIAAVGFVIAKIYRYYLKLHRKGLIQEPTDLSKDFLVNDQSTDEQADENELPKKKNRYTKSQARLRFKKGKS